MRELLTVKMCYPRFALLTISFSVVAPKCVGSGGDVLPKSLRLCHPFCNHIEDSCWSWGMCSLLSSKRRGTRKSFLPLLLCQCKDELCHADSVLRFYLLSKLSLHVFLFAVQALYQVLGCVPVYHDKVVPLLRQLCQGLKEDEVFGVRRRARIVPPTGLY